MDSDPNPYRASGEFDASANLPPAGIVKIRRVGVLSLGIFIGVAGAVGGFVAGFFIFLASLFGTLAGSSGFSMAMGLLTMVFAPLIYGAFGFLAGAIYAVLFNIVADVTGGLEIKLSR